MSCRPGEFPPVVVLAVWATALGLIGMTAADLPGSQARLGIPRRVLGAVGGALAMIAFVGSRLEAPGERSK